MNSVNQLAVVMETCFVSFEVRAELSNILMTSTDGGEETA
jgi:hypothetical protein